MNCYQWKQGLLVSDEPIEGFTQREESLKPGETLYRLQNLGLKARKSFRINHRSQWQLKQEDISLIQTGKEEMLPAWILSAIEAGVCVSVNGSYSDWQQFEPFRTPKKWRVHLVGLGDVGGVLLSGLRLLGSPEIEKLGLYDPDHEKIQRWRRELGQICFPFEPETDMVVEPVPLESLFDCDLFLFCASRGVPAVGAQMKDVRTVQFEGNKAILAPYVRQACAVGYQGIFAVVSDPVDHLSRFVQEESQRCCGEGKPLSPDQVRGYGLGVMNGRARWYASQDSRFSEYLTEGRAYGPHGQGLVIANSIANYSQEKTQELTRLTENANHEVRNVGFKPYVAPALSSGAISIIKTIRGEWHYSAVSLGGTFVGCCNRFKDGIQETETLPLPEALMKTLWETYDYLRKPI